MIFILTTYISFKTIVITLYVYLVDVLNYTVYIYCGKANKRKPIIQESNIQDWAGTPSSGFNKSTNY